MKYEYLMNIASGLYLICYIPELYANYKNKNANMYNMPEKIVILVGTVFAFAFSVMNEDEALMANYGPILLLDIVAMVMRGYYVYYYRAPQIQEQQPALEPEPEPEPGPPAI